LKNLEKMDKFVKDNMSRFEGIGEDIREVIQKIIEKGHYYEGQAEVLNAVAAEYNQYKKENR